MKYSGKNYQIREIWMKKIFILSLMVVLQIKLYPDIQTVVINAVGDTMTGTYYPYKITPPQDGAVSFDFIHYYLTNNNPDILMANLEGVITTLKEPVKKYVPGRSYAFNMPANTAKYLKNAGFNLITYANNHAMDFGERGLCDTERYLNEEKILFTGRKGDFLVIEKKGIKIGVIAFSWHRWANNFNETEKAIELIRKVKSLSDILVISIHGGSEGEKAMYVPDDNEYLFGEYRGNLYRFCRLAIDNGADLIIGHGPHVIRGIEIYKGKVIAYSLGNFLTPAMSTSGNKKFSFILKVELDRNGNFISGSVVPVVLFSDGIYRGLPKYDENKTSIKMLQKLSKENFKNNCLVIDDEGKLTILKEYKISNN
jgi:poly-gamma-glutamate capsule biosynthesis protein CapA/YwtB (metallophosphatase superfamily)